MRKLWLILVGVVLVVLLVAGGCASAPSDRGSMPQSPAWVGAETEMGASFGFICSQQQVGVWVTGEGKATAVPDVALLRLGIEADAPSVAEAQKKAQAAMDGVMKALQGNGVADKDIQTQQFSIYPVRRWIEKENREEITGYRITNIVVAKIRDISKAGAVIDAVADAGGDLTRVNDISFTVDNPVPYFKEARDKAIKDAAAKAAQMAQTADFRLGKLLYISEGGGYVPPVIRSKNLEAAAQGAEPTPISPGELEFQLTVQMVYKID